MNPILKRVLTGLSVAAAVVAAVLLAPVRYIAPVVGILALLAIGEFALLLRKRVPRPTPASIFGFLAGAAVIAGGLAALPVIAALHGNAMLLYIIAIVKFSDTGGFAFGLTSQRLLTGGNHKLCPTISPGKSWEGLAGSVIFSCVVSAACMGVTGFSLPKALTFGIVAALVGTFGDLVESRFKRWVGVKDSATFMPAGLGGFLDMFDSLLFAPAVLAPFI